MKSTTDAVFDGGEVGAQLGQALDRRGTRAGSLSIDAVRRGARWRHVRRRVVTGAASAVVVVVAVGLIASRNTSAPATNQPAPTIPTPVIEAAAVLPASYGEVTAVNVWANPSGLPRGQALPAVDVWERDGVRVVVRTFSTFPEPPDRSKPPVSTAPPPSTAAPFPSDGVIERLAEDQWVKYLSSDRELGDHIVVRGADRAAATALFDSMIVAAGVPTPTSGFELTEHADASSADEPFEPMATLRYGSRAEGLYVATTPLPPGRDSLESAVATPGALRSVGDHAVLESVFAGTMSMSWVDPAGYVIWAYQIGRASVDESIVSDVQLVTQGELERVAAALSARRALEPVIASASVAGFELSVRGDSDNVVFCIGQAGQEQCALHEDAGVNAPPIAGTMDTVIDGEWVVFGAFELGAQDWRPNFSDDRFVATNGVALPVEVAEDNGYLWYVVRVPADSPTIDVDWRNTDVGLSGRVGRPVVIGQLG